MKRILLVAIAIIAVGMMSSCSKEELKQNGYDPGVAEVDETRYLKVSVSNPASMTKADFEEGEAEENAIKDIRFVFYDVNGKITSNVVIMNESQIAENVKQGSGNVNSIVSVTLPVEITKGESMPAYVMCYVNSFRPGDVGMDSFAAIEEAKRVKVVGDGTDGNIEGTFPMNNSVYYGSDPVSGKNDVRIMATPIPVGALAGTPKEAQTITIHVERYAAKVKLTMPATIGDVLYDEHTLKFTPRGWAINALDKEMYLTKHFLGKDDMTGAEVTSAFGGWSAWNDAANYRSYWASSPGYYNKEYPSVSDDITDPDAAKAYFDVEYLKYNDIVAQENSMDKTVRYVRESTVSSDIFKETDGIGAARNPKAALPSVIIAGTYQIDDEPEGTDFYLYGGKAYIGTDAILQHMVANAQRIIYSDESGTSYYKTESSFEVIHPAEETRGDIAVPGRYVTLQLKKGVSLNGMYYLKDGKYSAVTENDFNIVNSLLMTSAGYSESYIGGMAYFVVPVKHIRWYESGNSNYEKKMTDEDWDWTAVRTGDFGIVRNHVYSIVIDKIEGRATGIHGNDHPIVPPTDINTYDVTYEVKTLNWAVVPTQNESL